MQMKNGWPQGLLREERKMKKFSLALLAIATALAISPVVSAETFDFSYGFAGNNGTGLMTGSLTATPAGGGVYDVTAGNIDVVFGDPNLSFNSTGVLLGSTGSIMTSPSGYFYYDNVLLPGQNPLITNAGLLFGVDGLEVNIFSNGASAVYPAAGTYQFYDNMGFNMFGNFVLSPAVAVPEYGALLMLILCALTLAGGFFFKSRQSGLILNS
jgi:hypothetical protein